MTPDPTPATTPLSDSEYHRLSQAVLAAVEAQVDDLLQRDVIDIDSSRTGGLLELTLPNGSKLILNTQPPLHEVWLAARSGGFHYRYAGGRWVDTRSGQELFEALSACASEQGGRPVTFTPPPV